MKSLAEVMEEHPELNSNGMGLPGDPLPYSYPHAERHARHAERQAEAARYRRDLAAAEARVMEIANWLIENVTPIKTPVYNSYGMKHLVEYITGTYTRNGELIAAGLVAGYSWKPAYPPNVIFGMSVRDARRLEAEWRRTKEGLL